MADALISHSNLSVCCDIVFIMLPKLLVFVLVNVQTFFFFPRGFLVHGQNSLGTLLLNIFYFMQN